MSLSLIDRHEQLKNARRRIKSWSEPELKSFRINPEMVVFQNFEPGMIYSLELSLLNLRQVNQMNP